MATRRPAYPFAEAHPTYGLVILKIIRGIATDALSGVTSVVDLSSAHNQKSHALGSSGRPSRLHLSPSSPPTRTWF